MISLFTHYSGLREYVGTEDDMPPFDVPNGSSFHEWTAKHFGSMAHIKSGYPPMVMRLPKTLVEGAARHD